MYKKIVSLILTLVLIFPLATPAFATEFASENQGDKLNSNSVSSNNDDTLIEPRMSWVYDTDPPPFVTFETTASSVKEGNTKLQQTLENIGVGILAGALVSVLPIPTAAQVVAGAILSALPAAFNGSTTLYYRSYEYLATGGLASFNKKCSVYFYYDEEMTVLADHVVYYASKC